MKRSICKRFPPLLWGGVVSGLWVALAFGQAQPQPVQPSALTDSESSRVQEWCIGVGLRGKEDGAYRLIRMDLDGRWEALPGTVSGTSLLPLSGGEGLLLTQAGQLLHWAPRAASAVVLPGATGGTSREVQLTHLLAWRLPAGAASGPKPMQEGQAPSLREGLEVLALGRIGMARREQVLVVTLNAGRIAAIEPAASSPALLKREEFFKTWRAYRCRKQGPERDCLEVLNSDIRKNRRNGELSTQERLIQLNRMQFADAVWEATAGSMLYVLAREKSSP